MPSQATPTIDAWNDAATDPAVLTVDGYGVSITARSGHLVISDGIAGERRVRRIPRMPRTVSRILILAPAGQVSCEAVRWMSDADISWVHIDRDGRTLATSGARHDDARLLRAQAFAAEGGPLEATGLRVTQELIAVKLEGQAANLEGLFRAGGQAARVREHARRLGNAASLAECRWEEAQAAAVYWQAWAGRVHMPFPPGDLAKVPGHWLTFAGRTSLSHEYDRNRNATDPVNALLNFAYRVGESEAVHACHALGLHPALGILHSDKQGRDSMALDLLEVLRPVIDRVLLAMLDTGLGVPYGSDGRPRYLDRRLFHETREGVVRLVPPLTHALASHAAAWGEQLRPHAEAAARTLALPASGVVSVPRVRRPARPRTSARPAQRRARLRAGTGEADLLPDDVWARVSPLIPARSPVARGGTGRPVDTAQDRKAVAGLAASELLGVPWPAVPVDVTQYLCKARLKAWTLINAPGEDRPAWEAIAEVLQVSGHLGRLLEVPPA